MWLADLWLKCVSVWSAVSLVFVDGVSRMDMLGLTWVALVLTVTVELTWNPSSKTLTYIHTHTCPSYTTSTHTFHKSCEPSPVIKRPSMRQSTGKRYHHRMAHHSFCNKIITKIMVSKEQRDERDNNHLLYSPAQLHLFFVSCSHVCLLTNKTSWFETEKKKAFGFYFDDSICRWCWNVKSGTCLGCATLSTTPVCYIMSWDAPDKLINKHGCSKRTFFFFFLIINIQIFLYSDGSECTRGFRCVE